MKNNGWKYLGVILTLVLSLVPINCLQTKADEKVIRVGYDTNSSFIHDEGGKYYGYGVEYLEKIAEYTGWKYEYVKDESWNASFDKLRNGDIDLLCTVHYTEDRAEEFLFSNIPLGYETSLLYTMSDSAIAFQDFDAIHGCKIGLLKESYSAQDFISYAKLNS